MRTTTLLFCACLACAAEFTAAQTHPFARPQPATGASINGRWNGVNLELRSNCASAQNNGNRGTYAQFDVGTNTEGNFVITQTGVTGLNCEYKGTYAGPEDVAAFDGTYSCTDGKQGTFRSDSVLARPTLLQIRFSTKLTGSETCDIQALLSMARFPP
jgi:hypothetical protein